MVATQGLRLGGVRIDGDDVYWLEGRPAEGGRTVLVRRTPDGHCADVAPAPFLKNGFVTYTSFNVLPKVTDDVIATWTRILREVACHVAG